MKRSNHILICVIAIFILAFTASDLSKYKVNETEFKDRILSLSTDNRFMGLTYYLPLDVIKIAKGLSPADQATMAKAVGLFAKAYVSSDGFKNELNKKLDQLKNNTDPNSPELKAEHDMAYEENLKVMKDLDKLGGINDQFFEMHQQLFSAMQQMGEVNEGSVEVVTMRGSAEQARTIFENKDLYTKNKNEFFKMVAEVAGKNAVKLKIANNQSANADLERQRNYKSNIKAQLEIFLRETADIDFNAKLVQAGNKETKFYKEFDNAEYRNKTGLWKQCFRIGRPAYSEFKKIAEEWIKEL